MSSTHHSRSRGRQRVTSTSEDEECDDFVQELQSRPPKCLLDVLKVRLSSMDLRYDFT